MIAQKLVLAKLLYLGEVGQIEDNIAVKLIGNAKE